ncbi:MAG: hypothetical protein RJA57_337, partial [Bacteroidota bacterium]
MRSTFLSLLLLPLIGLAQQKSITLEDIYKKGTFRGESVRADFGGTRPAEISTAELKEADGTPFGQADEVIAHPSNPAIALLKKGTEAIYRRSSKSFLYLYEAAGGKLTRLSESKVLHPTFSPDGSRIAFVENNDLVVHDLATRTTRKVTNDGKWNQIINGNCDWVYEEEFEFTRAYEWSPKGHYLAYYRFDESAVREFNMTLYDNAYNKDYRYKYPKAGDANSTVEIHIYNVNTHQRVKAAYDTGDIYIPRIKWTQDDSKLVVFWMNRHQNHLKLLLTDAATGTARLLYEEKNRYYVEVNDDWWFLKDGKHLLFSSEMNGYKQLYLYSLDGKTQIQLTRGNYDVAEVNAVDETNKRVFYTLAWPRPMDRNLFVSDLGGIKATPLTQGESWNRIELNDSCNRFYCFRSDINTPQVVSVHEIVTDKKKKSLSARLIRTVNESARLRAKMEEYGFGKAAFIRIPNSKGDTLNGWMLKPAGFDPAKRYPVLFCNYGGPGSQQVTNRYGAVSPWHQLLAQKGFIVVSVDNTGTGYRGEEFKKKTYLQLGKLEIEDQIDAAKYLAAQPYVDASRIGHWGWSYGGFMSALAISKGSDVFTAAISVAPVTSWRFYDNIYTERYMRTPQENPGGYDDNSPLNFTDRIKGKYLIIHGTADDNVHF